MFNKCIIASAITIILAAISTLSIFCSIYYNAYQINYNNMLYNLLKTNITNDKIILNGNIIDSNGSIATGIIFTKTETCEYDYDPVARVNLVSYSYTSITHGDYFINGYSLMMPTDMSTDFVTNADQYEFVAYDEQYYVYGNINSDVLQVQCIYDDYNKVRRYVKSQLYSTPSRVFTIILINLLTFCIIASVLIYCLMLYKRQDNIFMV